MSPRLRLALLLVLPLSSGCASSRAAWAPRIVEAETPSVAPGGEQAADATDEGEAVAESGHAPADPAVITAPQDAEGSLADEGEDAELDGEGDGDGDDDRASVAEEAESHEGAVSDGSTFPRYTADLTDEALAQLWKQDLAALGSMSVGFVDSGRLVNAVQVPQDPAWIVVSPHAAYGTRETVDYLTTAIRAVKAEFPEAPPLRVNQLSGPEGGWLRPHRSHQNGRDVDLAFYYPTVEVVRARERERYIDVEKNWALVKALVTLTDVQLILVDRRVQKVLYDHALAAGEDRTWLSSLFGPTAIIRHARRHRDHFHVRFYNGRAQELGRRVAPLLAHRPEQNVAFHRVRSGDTLGAIARRYGTTVSAIRKANNGMRSDFLRLNVVLRIPLRGPCTRCPVPPEVVVPPRKLPPPEVAPVAVQVGGDSLTGQP
jgi:murein endopeptidase/phage tail protein X